MSDLHELTQLGQHTVYPTAPNIALLQPIPRQLTRADLGLHEPLPFNGIDLWTHYEVSWLNARGKPEMAIAEIIVPADSPNLLESKSLKLYFNGFNQARFQDADAFCARVQAELSQIAQAAVTLRLIDVQDYALGQLPGMCLDQLDIECSRYQPEASLLQVDHQRRAAGCWHTHAFRSNCPVTNQPDWASILIVSEGPALEPASLLRYLVSFRQHSGFHEQCVERIFADLLRIGRQDKLTVYARYTRRGGLDINPFRSNFQTFTQTLRTARQ